MTRTRLLFTLAIFITIASCKSKTSHNSIFEPLFKKDTTFSNERDNNLLVFVGEKICVDPIRRVTLGDAGFRATYKIIQVVYGDYDKPTIEFEAYDHYGIPPFLKFKHVMLYTELEKGVYYQCKYEYDDVYKTKSGRWAGTYSRDYESFDITSVKPERIDFAEEVAYPATFRDRHGNTINFHFPSPYFKIEDSRAIPVYGNYIEDLFLLKKEGYFTGRQFFGPTIVYPEPEFNLQAVTDTTVTPVEPRPVHEPRWYYHEYNSPDTFLKDSCRKTH